MSELAMNEIEPAADRFNAWYIPHCEQLADRWYYRHPRTVACSEADMDSADRAWAEVERVRLGK